MRTLALLPAGIAAALAAASWLPLARPARQEPASASEDAARLLRESLAEQGIAVDLEAGLASLPAEILVRDDLLEYVLVGPNGQAHESLLLTEVVPSVLNAALLALGAEPGTNARWIETGEEDERGRPKHRALPPEGDGFYPYVAWREGAETYLYRLEDLLSNLASRRSMERHRWVFLGSRFMAARDGKEIFIADAQQNLINVAFFFDGNTLITAALPECLEQTIWAPNTWLLPPSGTPVRLLLARGRFTGWPAGWEEGLPEHARADEALDETGGEPGGEESGDGR